MISMKSRSILAIVVFLFLFITTASTTFAQSGTFHPLGFFGKLKLLPSLGIRKTLTVIMTPSDKKNSAYHTFVYDRICDCPGCFWAVPETNHPVCSNPQALAAGIKCGEVCPPERRVGPVCPEGHFCCRPADAPPVGTSKPTPARSPCSDGAGHTLQYCDIKF